MHAFRCAQVCRVLVVPFDTILWKFGKVKSSIKMVNVPLIQRKAMAIYLWQKKQKRLRTCSVRDIFKDRKCQGDYHNLILEMRKPENQDQFFNYLRMLPEDFDKLLLAISGHIQKCETCTEPISPGEMLAVTLRYLASGDSMASISYAFRLGRTTVSKIIKTTCDAIWMQLKGKYLAVPSEEQWKEISTDFESQWNMPHCFGAVDGKHVPIQAPPNTGSDFFNYKKTFSIVLMAICDAKYRFTLVDIGSNGRQSDGGIFRGSEMGKYIFSDSLCVSSPCPLLPKDIDVPYYIVGDEAFPLHKRIMRPYPGRFLSQEKRVFNYRLSRARRVIENSFGILASKWRIFRRPIIASVATAEKIIQATVCLHNFLRIEDELKTKNSKWRYCAPSDLDRENESGVQIDGDWRKGGYDSLPKVPKLGGNAHTKQAAQIRDYLCKYFMEHAPIEPQWNK